VKLRKQATHSASIRPLVITTEDFMVKPYAIVDSITGEPIDSAMSAHSAYQVRDWHEFRSGVACHVVKV